MIVPLSEFCQKDVLCVSFNVVCIFTFPCTCVPLCVLHCVIDHRVTSRHVTSRHVTSRFVMSRHVTLCHTTSHHIMYLYSTCCSIRSVDHIQACSVFTILQVGSQVTLELLPEWQEINSCQSGKKSTPARVARNQLLPVW